MTGTVNSNFAAKQKRYTRAHTLTLKRNIMMWPIHNPQFLFNLIISNELKLYLCITAQHYIRAVKHHAHTLTHRLIYYIVYL